MKPENKLTGDYFVAVRFDRQQNKEFFDLETIAATPEISDIKARDTDRQLKYYSKHNPVARIVKVKLNEVLTMMD